jgi:hypothetical protein
VRTKKIAFLGVKVYAVALYVEADKAAKELGVRDRGGFFEGDDDFCSALMDGGFGKALVVELVRDVEGAAFVEALNEALRPRMALAGGEIKSAAAVLRLCGVLVVGLCGGAGAAPLLRALPRPKHPGGAAGASPEQRHRMLCVCCAAQSWRCWTSSVLSSRGASWPSVPPSRCCTAPRRCWT